MGLQGNKATHDFLSLYTTAKDPTLQLHDAKPSPPPSQGFFLKTHDFLQPLEKPSQSPAAANAGDKQQQQQHVLPGGIGTFSIRRAADAAAGRAAAAVKEEPRPPFALWGQPAVPEAGARGHQWAFPYAALGVAGAGHVAASRQQPPERKGGGGGGGGGGFMDTGSRSSGGAGFDDDDDGLAARREGSSSLRELTVRVDAKGGSCSGSGTDQRPNTPRSKHSATEQRRRSKINDRFQILRDLLPNSDQKRDKASFLLEVIEYIRFLQEKVQKYEVSLPEWNQEHAKIMPWANIYFRSFWKNAQNKGQISGDALPDPLQIIRNGSSPEFVFSDKLDDNNHAVAPAAASGAQGHAETDPIAKVSYRSAETPMDVANKLDDNNHAVAPAAASGAQDHVETDPMAKVSYRSAETPMDVANNVMPQPPAHWTRSSPADDSVVNSKMLNDQDLTIDEGTISLSSHYSQQLLTTLNSALQNSGIDLSQASISVQINLGKRAVKRPATGSTSSSKELIDPASNTEAMGHQLRLSNGTEELSYATKRQKSDNS